MATERTCTKVALFEIFSHRAKDSVVAVALHAHRFKQPDGTWRQTTVSGHVKTAAKRAGVFCCMSYELLHSSPKRESRNETPKSGTIGQFYRKTQGFVGITVRLRALITHNDKNM